MRHIYTIILYLLSPIMVLRLYWKSWKLKAYRQRILERFSFGCSGESVDIWLHAVSLGEVIAATPLIQGLLAEGWRVMITTMTPTGSEQVIRRFGQRVVHQYIPYDFPWALRRFLKNRTPKLGIVMETELWPNLIHESSHIKMPLLLINARLSDRSFKQYERIRFFLAPVLQQFTAILAQSKVDAARFLALGASEHQVQVIGNLKFDVTVESMTQTIGHELKTRWGIDRPVVIAASTHHDEEGQLLACLKQLQCGISDVVLVIAPRHPERFQAIYALSQSLGIHTALRSQPDGIMSTTEVVVIDSLGELLSLYPCADYAFVGGSLVPIGGHNVLEPIAVGVPVFCGPYMHNSKAICEGLLAVGGIMKAPTATAVIEAMIMMHQHLLEREQQIQNASSLLLLHKGGVSRCLAVIYSLMNVGRC